MVKFSIVKTVPKNIKKGDFVLTKPDFIAEIAANRLKAPKNNLTGTNQLRYIADAIAMKYDPENMSAWSVKPHLFEGRQFSDDESLSKIVVEMLQICYPKVFNKYVEYQIKNLPPNTQMVYFVDFGVEGAAVPLFENGLLNVTQEAKGLNNKEDSSETEDN